MQGQEKNTWDELRKYMPVVDLTGCKKPEDYPSDVREWLDDKDEDKIWEQYLTNEEKIKYEKI